MELTFQNTALKLLSCSPFHNPACGSSRNSQPLLLSSPFIAGAPQASLKFLPCLAPCSSGEMSPVADEGKVPVEASLPLISLPQAQGSLLAHRMQKGLFEIFAEKKNVITKILGRN